MFVVKVYNTPSLASTSVLSRGYSGFQVTGMIEDFFLGGVEIFDSRIFGVGKFGKYFLGGLI